MRFSHQWISQYVEAGLTAAQAGERLTAVGLPLDSLEAFEEDTVLHLDVTTNRPDCMNHLGLARELAAATGRPLREPPREAPPAGGPAADSLASVAVEAEDLCGRYTALVIQGVRVGPSPDWLSRRLRAVGLRSINSVVDATNFVLWEMGHPLHAFDLSRLGGRRIVVRRARAGESLTTLDGITRKLDPETLVIADADRPRALAGVMGGQDSEISAATRDILLESAHFNPLAVRRTARKTGLHTDASHRFERGADLEATLAAAARCAGLIVQLAGGTIAGGVLEARSAPPHHREIRLRPRRVGRLLGLEVPEGEMRGILERLGCRVSGAESAAWGVAVPSFRGDLSIEEDLIEEIARHHGYDRIPTTLPRLFLFPEGRSPRERALARTREAVRAAGFSEAINLSLVSERENAAAAGAGGGIRVLNPLAESQDRLRESLLPGLLRNLAHNVNHGSADVRLFEIGHVFLPGSDGPREEERLALAGAGRGEPKHWSGAEREIDLFDLKGALENLARRVGLPPLEWQSGAAPLLLAGRSSVLTCRGARVGTAGQVAGPAAAGWGLEEPVQVAEISLDDWLAARPEGFVPRHSHRSRTPSVSRDLSFLVDDSRPWAEVEAAIREVEGVPVVGVRLFDRFQGRSIPPGQVSLAVNIVFQDPERTLVSGEVASFIDRIVQRLQDRLGAVLRGQ